MKEKQNKTPVLLQWEIETPYQGAGVSIQVMSSIIKDAPISPSDILFRTHKYEFIVKPTTLFYQTYVRESGYIGELKLYRRVEKSLTFSFEEFTYLSKSIIFYHYTENVQAGEFNFLMEWPDGKISYKGDFVFKLCIYRKTDPDTFKKCVSCISTTFQILSKPQVWLGKKRFEKSPWGSAIPKSIDLISMTQEEKKEEKPIHKSETIQKSRRPNLNAPVMKKAKMEFGGKKDRVYPTEISFSQDYDGNGFISMSPLTVLKDSQQFTTEIALFGPGSLDVESMQMLEDRLEEPQTAKLLDSTVIDFSDYMSVVIENDRVNEK